MRFSERSKHSLVGFGGPELKSSGVLEDKIQQMMDPTPDLRQVADRVIPASEPSGRHPGDLPDILEPYLANLFG